MQQEKKRLAGKTPRKVRREPQLGRRSDGQQDERNQQNHDHHKKHHKHPQQQHDNWQDGSNTFDRSLQQEPYSPITTSSDVKSSEAPQVAISQATGEQVLSQNPPTPATTRLPPEDLPTLETNPSPLEQPPTALSGQLPPPQSLVSGPNLGVICGVAVGGLVFVLTLIGVVVYKFRCRKKTTSQNEPDADDGVANRPPEAWFTTRNELTESPADSKFPSFTPGSRERQLAQRNSIAECLEKASRQEHASVVSNRSNPIPGIELAERGQVNSATLDLPSVTLPEHPIIQQQEPKTNSENLFPCPEGTPHRFGLHDAEITVEGEEAQIDRCLSYYMKRVSAEAPSNPRSPLTQDRDFATKLAPPLDPDPDPDNSGRRSMIKFTKTANLLEKVRRSQIRLNDEALAKAKMEGFRLSRFSTHRVESSKASSETFIPSEASRYDISSSSVSIQRQTEVQHNITDHWRYSSKSHHEGKHVSGELGNSDVLESSPGFSEPHSAFEYADYYDGYMTETNLSVRYGPTTDSPDEGFTVPWQNDSPCRSSALSPRASTTVSMRQRSATITHGSPLTRPQKDSWDANSKDAEAMVHRSSSHPLSTVIDLQRESAMVDEVIRF